MISICCNHEGSIYISKYIADYYLMFVLPWNLQESFGVEKLGSINWWCRWHLSKVAWKTPRHSTFRSSDRTKRRFIRTAMKFYGRAYPDIITGVHIWHSISKWNYHGCWWHFSKTVWKMERRDAFWSCDRDEKGLIQTTIKFHGREYSCMHTRDRFCYLVAE